MNTRILDATFDLFFEGQVEAVTLETIAAKAQVTLDEVTLLYPTLRALTNALSLRSIGRLKDTGEKLATKKGIEILKELVANDLLFFYRVEIDRNVLTTEMMDDHDSALSNFDHYFNCEMPKIYATFFLNNKDLLPSEDIDIHFYAHFISHSLKFFNFKTLVAYEKSSEGRKAATEQIIGSLFGRKSLDLPEF